MAYIIAVIILGAVAIGISNLMDRRHKEIIDAIESMHQEIQELEAKLLA